MTNYVKITDFAVKDSLPTSDPAKIVTGTAHDDEYNAIAVAIATKADTIHSTTEKTSIVDADEVSIADSGAAYVGKRITWANVKTVLANTFTSLSLKDATGGYAGLTLFKINFKNAANTFTSFFTNSNTAARTYTFQDRDGTVADLTDIAGIATSTTKLPTIGCTQSGGALTFSASSLYLDFRSTTLTSGTISTVLSAPSNLVLPSGGTLGAVTTVSARIVVVEINNAGTAELAIVNIAGGNDLSETGTINTTAIDTASDSANVFYSTTARTGVAYRVIGIVDVVNTAGAWGNPTLVQGAGGQAVTAMSSLGYGQTWQNVAGSRAMGTTYYNTSGRPILVAAAGNIGGTTSNMQITINSVVVPGSTTTSAYTGVTAIVPPGASYMVNANTGTPTLQSWAELR